MKRDDRGLLPHPHRGTQFPLCGVPPRGATWEPNRPPQMSTWELEQPKLEVPLTKRQLKHRRNQSFSIKIEVNKYIDKNGIEKSKEIELRFIDSFKFICNSLDSLVNNLAHRSGKFFEFKEYSENQYKLLIQKGIYSYEYMTDWDKFYEMKLPPREAFYSKLNMAGVREEDYEHARRVWKEFGLKDLGGEYQDLYLKTDVILLANVFEEFRKVYLKNYGLDPAHFYTAPGLAWKACLKKTRIRLELLLDPDMLLKFERGIRGVVYSEHFYPHSPWLPLVLVWNHCFQCGTIVISAESLF